ncbi:MarR family winged helix-turn-helix transcriptional regulator [Streptomyces sp. Q6]|uniref:MarR family winged helix-turn-helix transcriptional regulator n=1 Tax=Streptomyces citrinus TaxID=3118173 RepID=A0ACD5A8J7_9ACTN
MNCAAPSDDPGTGWTAEAAEAVETMAALWARAARSTSPKVSELQLQALLAARAEPHINLRALAEAVGAAPPAASRLCDRLEAAGLLRRGPAPAGRREIGLTLTTQGHDVLDTVGVRRDELFGAVLSRMPDAARQDLLTGLRAFGEASGPCRHHDDDGCP